MTNDSSILVKGDKCAILLQLLAIVLPICLVALSSHTKEGPWQANFFYLRVSRIFYLLSFPLFLSLFVLLSSFLHTSSLYCEMYYKGKSVQNIHTWFKEQYIMPISPLPVLKNRPPPGPYSSLCPSSACVPYLPTEK